MRCYPGETVRIMAQNLAHTDTGAVTAGAVVHLAIYSPTGSIFNESTVVAPVSGDDWAADFVAPEIPGRYRVTATATKDAAVWKGVGYLTVGPVR